MPKLKGPFGSLGMMAMWGSMSKNIFAATAHVLYVRGMERKPASSQSLGRSWKRFTGWETMRLNLDGATVTAQESTPTIV
jgi:hypothetical protein